tara:strand:+ start:1163 stop:1378 length:216 start_codon:yes stop_codon:yes gene_type:complete
MTRQHYLSTTGLYTIWYKNSPLHEAISPADAADLILYYKIRYDDKLCDWPLEPEHLRVKKFDGKYRMKAKR